MASPANSRPKSQARARAKARIQTTTESKWYNILNTLSILLVDQASVSYLITTLRMNHTRSTTKTTCSHLIGG